MSIRAGKRNTVFEKHNGRCVYCDRKLSFYEADINRRPTMDHKIPKSKGGTDDIDNLVLSCRTCNYEKGSMSYKEYMKKIKAKNTDNNAEYADNHEENPLYRQINEFLEKEKQDKENYFRILGYKKSGIKIGAYNICQLWKPPFVCDNCEECNDCNVKNEDRLFLSLYHQNDQLQVDYMLLLDHISIKAEEFIRNRWKDVPEMADLFFAAYPEVVKRAWF